MRKSAIIAIAVAQSIPSKNFHQCLSNHLDAFVLPWSSLMSVTVDVRVRVIQPPASFTTSASRQFHQQITECIEAQVKIVLVDLQTVNFIDSSGIGALTAAHTRLRLSGGKLYLCSPQEQARCLFDITDLDQLFEIFSSKPDFCNKVLRENSPASAQ